MEEYLTTTQLSERIKMAPGTIRNLVWKGEFRRNIHYVKPSRRKLLFIWGAVVKWLHQKSALDSQACSKPKSLINI